MKGDVFFVVNPFSGGGNKSRGLISRLEEKYGKSSVVITQQEGPNSAFSLGRWAAHEGFEKVLIGGGDGTYHLFVNGMMSNGSSWDNLPKIGLLNMGTGGNLPKNAGIPKNPTKALQVFDEGCAVGFDVGILTLGNGERRIILNSFSWGYDAYITAVAKERGCGYIQAAILSLAKGTRRYGISLNGQNEKAALMLALANGEEYGGIMKVTPNANMRDGWFDICLVGFMNSFKALVSFPRIITGTHATMKDVFMSRGFSITLASSDRDGVPCQIDGEILPPQKWCRIDVIKETLKILLPSQLLTAQRPQPAQIPAGQLVGT